jgi:Lon protease-like protein
MNPADEFCFCPEEFSGVARLFPLPNLVLFPHVMQPLRIFEPRYRELLEDALDDDGLIAMALLRAGWESDYGGRPQVEPVVCLGRVLTHRRLPEGDYNVLLLGLQRAMICRELPPTRPFRRAKLRLLQDRTSLATPHGPPGLRRQLLSLFQRLLPADEESRDDLGALLGKQLSLSDLTDIIAFTVALGVRTKQKLLSECDSVRRAQLLLSHLRALVTDPPPTESKSRLYLPQFSQN